MSQAPFIPETVIAQIKDTANIVSMISEFVSLKKVGRNFQGLCPFHAEKTPSFMVNEEKQIFHCFGCGLGGNIFTFLMNVNHLTFPEAVSDLARRFHIAIPETSSFKTLPVRDQVKEELRTLQGQAAEFFHHLLMKEKAGQKAREYLRHRGMTGKIAQDFLLGYAPEGWETLATFFKKKKVPEGLLEQSGLVIKREKGNFYDRFRNRLIFPILDEQKRVIGFGGRALGPESPKYLNSPESPLFSKSRVLYGLPQAQASIRSRNQVVLVEGYFDLLSLHLHGFTQAVATMGTALGATRIRRLKGMAQDIILLFDGDPPGIQAALRSVPLFQEEGVSARIKVLPPDTDPDSFLFQVGPKKFSDELQLAVPMMTFFLDQQIQEGISTVKDQARVIDRLIPTLNGLVSEVERGYYVSQVSQKLNVSEAVLWRALKSQRAGNKGSGGMEHFLSGVQVKGLEWRIIEALLRIPEALPILRNRDLEKILESTEARTIYKMMLAMAEAKGNVNPSLLVNGLEDQSLKNLVAALAIQEFITQKDEKVFLSDLLKKIQMRTLQDREKALSQEISAKEKLGLTEELKSLLALKQDLLQRRKELLISSKG